MDAKSSLDTGNKPDLWANGLRNGDETCFKLVYYQYYSNLVYFANKLIQQLPQAEDIVAEAFVKLWNYRTSIENDAHIKFYLFRSVKHAVIDALRTKNVRQLTGATLSNTGDFIEAAIDLTIVEAEVLREIFRQIELLPLQCATVAKHILVDGMDTAEIAATMGISTKTVLNQKLLAVQKIRSVLLKKGLLSIVLLFFNFFLLPFGKNGW